MQRSSAMIAVTIVAVMVPIVVAVPVTVAAPLMAMRIVPAVGFIPAAVPFIVQPGFCIFGLAAVPAMLAKFVAIVLLGFFNPVLAIRTRIGCCLARRCNEQRCSYGKRLPPYWKVSVDSLESSSIFQKNSPAGQIGNC